MRPTLLKWISDADALRQIKRLDSLEVPFTLGYLRKCGDDLYIALVGELFDHLRSENWVSDDCLLLGNALAHYADQERVLELDRIGICQGQAKLYAATAFYFGGYSASAHFTMRMATEFSTSESEAALACYDLLAKPSVPRSELVSGLIKALEVGDVDRITEIENETIQNAKLALRDGPESWIPLRLLQGLLSRFQKTNLRAVLPQGELPFWNSLVSSLIKRKVWDFFPSQIGAIENGLLLSHQTFSLQMPTSSGKTALCETLLYFHLNANSDATAVMLVPFRSLASELRGSLVKNLNRMGIDSRSAYGGTVPGFSESSSFEGIRALIATPETLSGIIGSNSDFTRRISLVICDEGHLLDDSSRGVGLELLLARLRSKNNPNLRYVFVSAIVPNIEEINAWLGGNNSTVVRSTYRPAIAEFAQLVPTKEGERGSFDLLMHAQHEPPMSYPIQSFLRKSDLQYINPTTNYRKGYGLSSFKTKAIASARKTLPMGATLVFCANKAGNQGAMGVASELLKQLEFDLNLPKPLDFCDKEGIHSSIEYLESEYGSEWLGSKMLKAGAIIHHGDIPQETREILEALLRDERVRFGVCTNTLAEGVNLPIRTLVLYSVQRLGKGGSREDLSIRDIKNLVGRAGRAGSNTKGLVININDAQWHLVKDVANQVDGHPVRGALKILLERLGAGLLRARINLTNRTLNLDSALHSLTDGIDSTLIELLSEEIGEEQLISKAIELADQTFASMDADEAAKKLLRDVFTLRSKFVWELRGAGKIGWITETGAKARMIVLVEEGLLPAISDWSQVSDPMDAVLLNAILEWTWTLPEIRDAVTQGYKLDDNSAMDEVKTSFFRFVGFWIGGTSFEQIASQNQQDLDSVLAIYARVLNFSLQTVVEQGVAILGKIFESRDESLPDAVAEFPEHLRHGVPTRPGRLFASYGVRHRRAYVELGRAFAERGDVDGTRQDFVEVGRRSLTSNEHSWRKHIGNLVYINTMRDLSGE